MPSETESITETPPSVAGAAPRPSGLRRWLSRVVLLLLLALTFWARTYNADNVFQNDGRIYFVDGDCYSRMERAKMVTEGHWIIKHHDFENWPQGVTPHTTAPLDWLIVGLKVVCDGVLRILDPQRHTAFQGQTLDLAGALISPLLAVATALWLWWWAGWMRLPYRSAMVFFFAVCPILMHGFSLGRPDHQSLVIFYLAVCVGAELALSSAHLTARQAHRWAMVAGVGWAMALWVSLYEPLVFFAGAVGWHLLSDRRALLAKSVRIRWYLLGGGLVLAFLVDGWRISFPEATVRQYFPAWSQSIVELGHLDLGGTLVWKWFGLFWVLAPVLLVFAGLQDRRAWGLLLLIGVMIGLTVWQFRWGYFAALAIALSLPWQLRALRLPWAGWVLAAMGILPMRWGWKEFYYPTERARELAENARAEWRAYRDLATIMAAPGPGGQAGRRPFLAPWWRSPQLAYWSGQPGVAGSSHQSLPGIVDTARFFLAQKPETAAAILRERGVRWVVIEDLENENPRPGKYPPVINAAGILGITPSEKCFGWKLADSARNAPPYLRYVTPEERGLVIDVQHREKGVFQPTTVRIWDRQLLKLYEVLPDKL